MEYIITFYTHFDALQYKRMLKSRNIRGNLQPVPRALSSSCGTCIRFSLDELITEKSDFLKADFEKAFKWENSKYNMIAQK